MRVCRASRVLAPHSGSAVRRMSKVVLWWRALQPSALLYNVQRIARRPGDFRRELRRASRRQLLAQQFEHAAALGQARSGSVVACAGDENDEFAALLIR